MAGIDKYRMSRGRVTVVIAGYLRTVLVIEDQ